MLKSKFRWNMLYNNEINEKEQFNNILLSNRNIINEIDKQLFFSENYEFHDPFLFRDMKKVVKRLNEAINKQEKIMIYGDYDVDGVTGTTILYKALKKSQANVFYYIPNRFIDGYGPNMEVFKKFVNHDFKVIVTVDNGITGVLEAEYLKSVNVDLIITDHHEEKKTLPDAFAIIHPSLIGETYPFKELSGCGVAFKLSHALLGYVPLEYMDLASLGTYADMVSLVAENRLIVKLGLKQISVTSHIGLRLLTQIANVKVIDEYALGFIFGPRLNAPGRMDNGNVAVRLLVTEDIEEAKGLVTDIENLNNDRKVKINIILEEAQKIIENCDYDKENVLIVSKEGWHEGVLGIIANRLVDIYHKPVIVLTEVNGLLKGSARTLEDFPLFENLTLCDDILNQFGGHKMAAGLSLIKENLPLLREKLHNLAGSNLTNNLAIDCQVGSELISIELTKNLDKFRPFGLNNQKPLFLLKNFEVVNVFQLGEKKNHLKLNLRKNNKYLTAIAFNMGYLFYNINNNDVIDVVGNFEINEYNNKITNQFIIVDCKINHNQIFDYRSKPILEEYFKNTDFQYLYFTNNYGYQNAVLYKPTTILNENLVLIDIPSNLSDLKLILKQSSAKNFYLLFKCDDVFSDESLMTRKKMGEIYKIYKKRKQFKMNDPEVHLELSRLGFNKKIQILSINVFFELNFAIIKDNIIKFVDNPEKRQLTESKTFRQLLEQVELKEKLVLSTSLELKEMLNNLIYLEAKNEN